MQLLLLPGCKNTPEKVGKFYCKNPEVVSSNLYVWVQNLDALTSITCILSVIVRLNWTEFLWYRKNISRASFHHRLIHIVIFLSRFIICVKFTRCGQNFCPLTILTHILSHLKIKAGHTITEFKDKKIPNMMSPWVVGWVAKSVFIIKILNHHGWNLYAAYMALKFVRSYK